MSILSDITSTPQELAAKDAAKRVAAAAPPPAAPQPQAATEPQQSLPPTPHLIRDTTTGQHFMEDADGGIFLKDSFGTVKKFDAKQAGNELASGAVWGAASPEDVKAHLDKQEWDKASFAAKSDFVARRALVDIAELPSAPLRLGATLFGAPPELTQKLSGENIVRGLDTLLAGEKTAAAESEGARTLEGGAPEALKVGTDVGAFVLGGAGLGKLASAAGPVADALSLERAGARVGNVAEGIAKSMGVSAEHAARLGAYADTVAQGAAIGNTQAAHEAWVKDEKLTSEAQWNAIGLGALLGVGGHVAVDALRGLPRAGLNAAEKVFGKPRVSAATSEAEAQELVESLSGVKQPEGMGAKVQDHLDWVDDKLTELQAKKTGIAPEKLREYKAKAAEIESMAARRDDIWSEGATKLTKQLEELHSESAGILKETTDVAMKKEHMARLLTDVDEAPIMQLAKDKAAELQAAYENLNAVTKRGRSIVGTGKAMQDMKGAYETAIDALADATRKEDVTSALDVFKREMDGVKVRAQQLSTDRAAYGEVRKQAQARAELAMNVANETRSLLEDTSLFGKFGEAQKEGNAAWTRVLDSDKFVRGQFFRRTGEISGGEEYGAIRREIDPAAVQSYLNGLGTARSQLADGYLRDNLEARANLVETLGKYYDLGEHTSSIQAASKSAKAAQETLKELDGTLRALNLRDEVMAHGAAASGQSHDGIATAAMLGHLLGGPIGSGVALAAKAVNKVLSDPVGFTKQMLVLRAGAKKLTEGISRNVTKALERAPRIASAPGAAARVVASKEAPEKLQRRYATTAARVAELGSNPEAAIDAVSNSAQHIAHPGVQQAYVTTGLNVLGFLVSKLPEPLYKDSVAKGQQLNNVSATQRDTFMRYAAAANRPADFFRDLADGTATNEQAEAAATLMPEAFAHAQQEAVLAFAGGKVKTDYQQRLRVQRLLKVQIEPMANPALQAFIQQSAQQSAQSQPAPRSSGSGKSSAASSLASPLSNLKI
jgi:hypothetical protein